MLPHDGFDKDIWYILNKIKNRILFLEKGENTISHHFYYRGDEGDFSKVLTTEDKILDKLQSMGIVKLFGTPWTSYNFLEVREGCAKVGAPLHDYNFIKVLQPKFDNFYKEHGKKIMALEEKKSNTGKIIFILDHRGNLSRLLENGNRQSYTLKGTKKKIVEELVENGSLSSEDFAQGIRKKANYIRKEIGDLRKKIGSEFGIDAEEFIPLSEGDGYTLGPKVKITPKQ